MKTYYLREYLQKGVFSILITYLFTFHVYAQDVKNEATDKKAKHGIGVAAGLTIGYGLSYRYSPSRFSAQLTFAPYHTKETDRYSTGLTFLYSLIDNKITTLYLYQGNHYFYENYISLEEYQYGNPVPIRHTIKNNYVNNGLGVGMEILIVKKIGFNLMAGYAFYNNFEELSFTGETGLYYKF